MSDDRPQREHPIEWPAADRRFGPDPALDTMRDRRISTASRRIGPARVVRSIATENRRIGRPVAPDVVPYVGAPEEL